MVILEGPDGGGKSTLAKTLAELLDMKHIESEGPEKYPGEINERINRYNADYGGRHDVIFDRHPCVSQLAYCIVHSQGIPNPQLISQFYKSNPLLIYCRPDPAGGNHTAGDGEWDTPEYLAKVDSNFSELMEWYDRWAVWNAHYTYRIGDPTRPIEELIKGWRKI